MILAIVNKSIALGTLLLLSSATVLPGSAVTTERAEGPPGAALFDAEKAACFELQLSDSAASSLSKSSRTYVAGLFKAGTNVLQNVGIRLKGHGSFQPLDKKPSFSIKFDKFSDQRYLGLSKILLNNSGDDPSYLREYIANRMFRQAGLPAPRIGHARVELNGRDLGLYVVAEGITKEFLVEHFGCAGGNLYEGEFKDIDKGLEQDDGDDKSQRDLKALTRAATIMDPSERWRNLREVLDVDRFISFMAIEQLVGQTDGYGVDANNYRIYHDPISGKMVFFPHGLDRAFSGAYFILQPRTHQILTRAVLQTAEGRRAYRDTLEELFKGLFDVGDLTNCISEAAIRLRQAARSPKEVEEIELNGAKLLSTIVERVAAIAGKLAAPELKPVQFDSSGVAFLTDWTPFIPTSAKLDEVVLDGAATLHVFCSDEAISGSFRTRVLLDPGRYILAGDLRIISIEPCKSRHPPTHPFFRPLDEGSGVGLFPVDQSPKRLLTGSSDWQQYEHEFEVNFGPQEIELACELRLSTGEAWFKRDSLRLIKR
jgi:spore coat protein H